MNKFIFELCLRYNKSPLHYKCYNTFIHALLHELSVELEADRVTKESHLHNTLFVLSESETKELLSYKEILLNESSKIHYVFSKKHKEKDWYSIFINFGNKDEEPDEVSQYYINFKLKDYKFICGTKLDDETIEKIINGKI